MGNFQKYLKIPLDKSDNYCIIEAYKRQQQLRKNEMLTQEQIDFILSLPYETESYEELCEMLEGEFTNPEEFNEAGAIFDREYEAFETFN